jgi:hypothetical protein
VIHAPALAVSGTRSEEIMRLILALVFGLVATSASADGYRPVTDRGEFLQLMGAKSLSNRLYGITLRVAADGTISGTGAGWDVTGTWQWQDGFFCRQMDWGGSDIPYNCQLVEVRNGNEMRFTVDQGAGDSASFKLR